MRTRVQKTLAVLLCVLLSAGALGVAAADQDADPGMVLEKFGESLIQVLGTIFDSRGDTATAGSWLELKLAAMQGKSTIVITGDITFAQDEETLEFSRAVTLMAAEGEHYTIDGGGRQILCVQGPDADTRLPGITYLINLTFTGGDATKAHRDVYGTGSGGAVFAMSDVRAVGCVFTGNTAVYGAAICADGDVALDNCTVEGNTSMAGAVYALGGSIGALGGAIRDNAASQYGGGLYAHNGDVQIAGTQISGNTAQFGGGLYAQSGQVTVMGASALTGNTAEVSGGAVYAGSGGVKVESGTVSQNQAQYGAVYLDGGMGTFSGGLFADNRAEFGGAIFAQTAELTLSGDLALTGNTAQVSGGGVYAHEGAVSVSGGTYSQNSAQYGGCLYLDSGDLTVSGGALTENTAEFGGAIYLTGGDLALVGGSLTDNTAAVSGGAAYCNDGAVDVSGASIKQNEAQFGGGLIAINGSITLSAGMVYGNTAQNGGGLYTAAGAITVTGGRVAGNTATDTGGGAYTETGTIDDSVGAIFANTPDDSAVAPE